jgi:hypothetical protein
VGRRAQRRLTLRHDGLRRTGTRRAQRRLTLRHDGLRRTGTDQSTVYGWSIRYLEFAEIGRIVPTLAIMIRNDLDLGSVDEECLHRIETNGGLGVLIEDVDAMSAPISLGFRESLNKIIHADTVNLERSKGPSIFSGYLLPYFHLYGRKQKRHWNATINVFPWAEAIHAVA